MMAGAVIGFLAYQVTLNKTRKPAVAAISKFDEVLYYLNAAYVDSVNAEKIEQAAIVSMMDELDPHRMGASWRVPAS